MKASSATSAKATAAAAGTDRSSARHRRTPTSAASFALAGPSDPPDPDFNAYRQDLADVALTGQVIASHYAEPVHRIVTHGAPLRHGPSDDAQLVRELVAGEPFDLLDDSVGWAWGYAGDDRRVGYVRSESIGKA